VEEPRRDDDDDEGRLSVDSDAAGSSSAGSDATDSDAGDVPDPGWADDADGARTTGDVDDNRPGTSESIRRRTEAMSPEQRERAARAAADAAAEFSAPDP
jgi:hypothetical protein